MRVLVCYPMKTLVSAFVPENCEAITVENEEQLMKTNQIFQPQAVVLFTEAFSKQVWEWVPEYLHVLPAGLLKVFIPIHRDQLLVRQIVEEAGVPNAYVLSDSLTYAEIKEQLSAIFGVDLGSDINREQNHNRGGKVFTLLSYGAAGITTFCINYPVLLAKRFPSSKIAVIDMNVEKPDLSKFFQLKDLSLFRPDLIDEEMAKKRDWMTLFKQSSAAKNLFYAKGICRWKSHEVSTLLKLLRSRFDYIYVDWGFCFPETEGLIRLLKEADQNLFFVRADPFSLENATQWVEKWKKAGIRQQILVSHHDHEEMSRNQIREKMQVYGILPRVPDGRVSHSHRRRSVLVEEFLPPRPYIESLLKLMDSQQKHEEAALC